MTKRTQGAVWIGALILIVLVLQPILANKQELKDLQESKQAMPNATEVGADQSAAPVAQMRFAPLIVHSAPSARGFTLTFDERQSPVSINMASIGSHVVHTIARYENKQAGKVSLTRYDAVVVDPDTGQLQVYPLYESSVPLDGSIGAVRRLDDQSGWCVRPVAQDGKRSYDVVRLRAATGELTAITKGIFEEVSADESGAADVIVGIHESKVPDGSVTKVMLTSRKGRVQVIDPASAQSKPAGTKLYPAELDSVGKQMRERLVPSPDLGRFVAQTGQAGHYEVFDLDRGGPIGSFQLTAANMAAAASTGAAWNADGSMFYLAYGSRSASGNGVKSGDHRDSMTVDGIRFYDRDGQLVRTLEFHSSTNAAWHEVFGWSDPDSVWLTESAAGTQEENGYLLYNVKTDEMVPYQLSAAALSFKETEAYVRQSGTVAPSRPLLLADHRQRLVWPAPKLADAFVQDGEAYLQLYTDIGGYVMRWDDQAVKWRWTASSPGYKGPQARSVPAVHERRWLIYPQAGSGPVTFSYVMIGKEVRLAEGGLPIIPVQLAEAQVMPTWWNDPATDRYKQATAVGSPRAAGFSRYGTIRLHSLADEVQRIGDTPKQYHGTYSVSFTDKKGVSRQLPDTGEFTLMQEDEEAQMERIELDGMDILLLRTNSFRFSKGYDGGGRTILAYAVTDRHEAFPLSFRYANASGQTVSADRFVLDDNAPVAAYGKSLIFRADLDGVYEVRANVDLDKNELRIAGLRPLQAEYAALHAIVDRYSNLLVQALGLDEGLTLPEGRMEEQRLQRLMTDQARENPGYRLLAQRFADEQEQGISPREFAWEPIDYSFVAPDTIRVTFTFNLFYAIGLAAHLEADLKLAGGVWRFYDFGTLTTQKLDTPEGDMSEVSGLLVEDPLKLE